MGAADPIAVGKGGWYLPTAPLHHLLERTGHQVEPLPSQKLVLLGKAVVVVEVIKMHVERDLVALPVHDRQEAVQGVRVVQ